MAVRGEQEREAIDIGIGHARYFTAASCYHLIGVYSPWCGASVGMDSQIGWIGKRIVAFFSRLPHAEPCFAKTNRQINFHVASAGIRHRVINFEKGWQKPQSELLDVSIRLNARLMFVEACIRIESGHADINAWLARNGLYAEITEYLIKSSCSAACRVVDAAQ